jgi:DNA-binding beta-propeller fold protein YncE
MRTHPWIGRRPAIMTPTMPVVRALPWLLLMACDNGKDTGDAGYGGSFADQAEADTDTDSDTDTDADADSDPGWDTGDYDDGFDAEEEGLLEALRPAATADFLFIANPDRDSLTRIRPADMSVITTPVGHDPSVVRVTPDGRTALVLNMGSESVSLVDAESLVVTELAIRPRLNRLELSPDGRWGICWFSEAAHDEAEDDGATASYNEISLIDVENKLHVPMVVGFNPRDVAFAADGSKAVVVSDVWLATLDLTATTPSPIRLQLVYDTVDAPKAEEILITPDGGQAFVRQFATTYLSVVDLNAQTLSRIDVGDNATDLDLSPDGAQAAVVARGSHELWLFDAADPSATPEIIALPPDETFGSLRYTPDGTQGILYTTAAGLPGRYGTWVVGQPEITVRGLVKPVRDVMIDPTGGTVLFVHDDEEETGVASDSPFRGGWALSIVETAQHFANPVRLGSRPTGFAHGEDGSFGAFIMGGERFLEVVDYGTLLFDEVLLKSPATNMGIMPGSHTVFVSQDHDLGRISLYDVDGKGLTTVTGFELNAGIEID